jgi:T4 bacteriophage base plate protein
MQEIKTNPLAKHFRQPAIYIGLTSGGKFWKEGSLELPVTGKIPVLPMTTRDEITLRTPDALINGTSVVEVIQSCCPNIKNAWDMPSVDVDSTLIAIRIASYGPTMPIESKCPHCEEEHEYDIELSHILDNIRMPDYSKPVALENLEIYLKPMNYLNVSKSGEIGLEEERLIQTLANSELSEEEKNSRYEEHLKRMIDLSINNITNCTLKITTSEGETVTDPAFIKEYYSNAEAGVLRQIQAKLKEYSDVVGIKPLETECSNCNKNFDINIQFDYSSFFGQGF